MPLKARPNISDRQTNVEWTHNIYSESEHKTIIQKCCYIKCYIYMDIILTKTRSKESIITLIGKESIIQ